VTLVTVSATGSVMGLAMGLVTVLETGSVTVSATWSVMGLATGYDTQAVQDKHKSVAGIPHL
jgi:hypothetical protein